MKGSDYMNYKKDELKGVNTGISIPKPLYEKIMTYKDIEGRNKSNFICHAVEVYINNMEKVR